MPALTDAALDAMDYAVDRNDQDHWTRFLDEWGVRAEDMELILALHKAYSRGFRCAKRTIEVAR